jgi:hypothetical protein
MDTSYKPGGTMTTIVGKWHAPVSEKGTDPSGLGQWSFMIISSNKKNGSNLLFLLVFLLFQIAWPKNWMPGNDNQMSNGTKCSP